jgi:glycosyltransferase involved in cell wall biosynthesis
MTIEFVIATYINTEALIIMLQCLRVQTSSDWKAHVVIDGHNDAYERIRNMYANDDRIRFTNIDGPNNDYGHTPRNYGLEQATGDFVILTSDDNYYVPTFVEVFTKAAREDTRFMYCNMIHNYSAYKPQECHPRFQHIDIGNMVMRTEFAKQLRLDVKAHMADGWMCEEFISKFCQDPSTVLKINNTLYVHN